LARCFSVADGFQVWAHRFERPVGDLLAVCDEIARAVAVALTTEVARPARSVTRDPVAVELYLRGRAKQRANWTNQPGIRESIELLERSLALAPDDGVTLAALAVSYARLGFWASGEAELRRAQEAAERATRLAPLIGESWLALGVTRQTSQDHAGAVRALAEAVRVAPKLAKAHEMLGRILGETGELEEAIRHLERAMDLDPHTIDPIPDLARLEALRGNWARADALLEGREPSPTIMGARVRLVHWRGLSMMSQSWLPQLSTYGPGPMPSLREVFVDLETTGKIAADTMARFRAGLEKTRGRLTLLVLQLLAELYLRETPPDEERSLDAIEAATRGGLIDLMWLDCCPLFPALRGHPRWAPVHEVIAARAAEIRAALTPPRTA
jgi:serine/threonine-protein kinase